MKKKRKKKMEFIGLEENWRIDEGREKRGKKAHKKSKRGMKKKERK